MRIHARKTPICSHGNDCDFCHYRSIETELSLSTVSPPLLTRPRISPRPAGIWGPESSGGGAMTMVPVMWSIWGALILILAVLYLYRSRLERDEEDQIFLDDSFNHVKSQQAAILDKVNKIQPAFRVSMGLAGAATLFVIAYYVWDVFNQFK